MDRCEEPGSLVITVSNFGRGIRPDWIVQGLIWQRGWRNPHDEDPDSFVTGTGIGCAVIKEAMALHGGAASADSHLGGLTVPRRDVDDDYLRGCKTTFTLKFKLPEEET